MKITDYFIENAMPEHKQNRKRFTVYLARKHKRMIEDVAHKYRISQAEALFRILETIKVSDIKDW